MRRSWTVTLALVFLLCVLTGCQLSQSGFSRTASNAGAAFSAASTTLTYAHTGKLTAAYAQSSFESYRNELNNTDQQLSSQRSSTDTHTIQHLLQLYKPAMQAINSPCLADSCDWHQQVADLNRASDAFLKAGSQ